MNSLFESKDPERWDRVLSTYWDVVKGVGKDKLEDLERWYQNELPDQLINVGKLEKKDLVKLVDWKLTRGKWRPRLLSFAEAANERDVTDASLRSFAKLDHLDGSPCSPALLKEAMTPLIALKGIGPATATGIISAREPSVPFMSDEALVAALGYREYTMKEAVRLMEVLQKKAAELNTAEGSGTNVWSARLVERALFAQAAAASKKPAAKKGFGTGKKRKR